MKALATAALAAIVLTFSDGASAANPPPNSGRAKPSSFAPRDTGQRVFGAPIQPPIIGPRKNAHHDATTRAKRSKAPTPTKSAAPKKTKKGSGAKGSKPAEAAKG